jgi:hypothetical protein
MGRIAFGCRTPYSVMPGTADLRLEGGLDVGHEPAETNHHGLKHMIAADTQPIVEDLHIRVPIAQMPGQADEIKRTTAFDLGEQFDTTADAHDRSIVEHKTVAVPQVGRVRQIQQKTRAALSGQHQASAMPIVGVENHAVDGGCVPLARRPDFAR